MNEIQLNEIQLKKPKGYLTFDGSTKIYVHRNFNWLQKKMLKWCFGLQFYKNDN